MPNSQFKLSMMGAAITALFAPTLHAASAGKVDFATPGVNAIGPNGQARPLAKGAEIAPGETIDTGTGRAQLRFTDGGLVSLAPQTQFRLESYGYDKDDAKKNSVVMNLLKGGLRSITGLIGKTNREGYKLQTATATVGIRGTEFSITGFPDGSILFNVTDGAIDVTNQSGTSTVSGGQSANVSSSTSAPAKTDEKPFLPPAVAAAQTQIPAPPNPVQDSTAIAQALLTGTRQGQWATVSFQNGSAYPNQDVPGYAGPTFTLSPSGHLTGYSYGGYNNQTIGLGTASAQSYGNDGVMAWGRWTNGQATSTQGEGSTYSDASPLHYVVGLPVTAMPTSGSATYSMYGATAPSCTGGACGAITVSGSISVSFGTQNAGSYSLSVANAGDGVKLSGTGAISFNSNNISFNGGTSMTSTGSTAAVNASSNIAGFLAGPAASHAGAIYQVGYATATGVEGSLVPTNIIGAAVYKR